MENFNLKLHNTKEEAKEFNEITETNGIVNNFDKE